MMLNETMQAVCEGKTVNWKSSAYIVINDGHQYLILCLLNDSCIGLTWTDGITLNGRPEDFYIGD